MLVMGEFDHHSSMYAFLNVLNRSDIGRDVSGFELATISDYRLRLNTYRADAYLLGAHLAGPWITVW
jgi:phosphodiesterase/alkaline phosphatase D-like protein